MSIECKICGMKLNVVMKHVGRYHKLTKQQYLQMFPNAELISKDYHDNMSVIMKGNRNRVHECTERERMIKSEAARRTCSYHHNIPSYREAYLKGRKVANINAGKTLHERHLNDKEFHEKSINQLMINSKYKGRLYKYNEVEFRSRLELLVAKSFDSLNIKWEYEPRQLIRNNGKSYTPDFYLPSYDIYIEVSMVGNPRYTIECKEYKLNSLGIPNIYHMILRNYRYEHIIENINTIINKL